MYTQERDEVIFREPMLEQQDVQAKISFAEPSEWKLKDQVKAIGGDQVKDIYKACKLTVAITDDSVKTEHPDALPKMIVEDQFCVQKYPYVDKKTGKLAWMNRQKLFDLERAFGFDPCFVDRQGNSVEPYISRTGSKLAPKVDGCARVINADFLSNYFHEDMTINPTNWIDKSILVDIGVEKSEQYGDKNIIKRYKKVSTI